MNKRITGLAVLMLLLLSAGAWAATPTVTISSNTLSSTSAKVGEEYSGTFEYTANNADGLTVSIDAKLTGVTLTEAGVTDIADGETNPEVKFTPITTGRANIAVTIQLLSSDEAKTVKATAKKTFVVSVTTDAPAAIAVADDSFEGTDLGMLVNTDTGNIGITKHASDFDGKIKFKTTATLPITGYSVTGLPAGVTYELTKPDTNEATADGTVEDDNVELTLTGAPTRAGIYENIVVSIQNAGGLTKSDPYTLRVFDTPTIATKTLPAMTWGKDYSTKVAFTGGLKDYPVSFDAANPAPATLKLLNLSFDYETGELWTLDTYMSNDATQDEANLKFGNDTEKELELTFKVKSPSGEESEAATLSVKVKAVPPKILSKDEMVSLIEGWFDTVTIGSADGKVVDKFDGTKEVTSTMANTFYAVGPGTLTWTFKNLPAGIKSADNTGDDATPYGKSEKLDIDDTVAAKAVKRHPVNVTVKNSAGADNITVYITLGTDFCFTEASKTAAAIIAGIHNISHDLSAESLAPAAESGALPAKRDKKLPSTKKDEEPAEEVKIELNAYPGPVIWQVKNLPVGLKLSIDKSVEFDTKAYITGTYDRETKKNQHFTIKASNKILGLEDTISGDVTVYAPPKITTSSLPALTLGKPYTAKLAGKGLDLSLDVKIEVSADSGGSLPGRKGIGGDWAGGDAFTGENAKLTYNAETFTITGSLDKWPDDDSKNTVLKVTVYAGNPGYTEATGEANGKGAYATKVIPLKLKAVAPKFTTSRFADFDGVAGDDDGSKHIVTITGYPAPTIRAYVASKDAAKLGFVDPGTGDYELTADSSGGDGGDNDGGGGTGALPATKKASITPAITYEASTKGELTTLKFKYAAGQGYALSGIPLTISADNGAGKETVKVFKFAITGRAPVIVSPDNTAKENILSKDVTLYCVDGASDAVEVTIQASGDKPITWQSNIGFDKAKNGITVTSEDNATTGIPNLKITAQPNNGKETKTAITITAINPITKQKYSRKINVIASIPPKITTAEKARTKEGEVGKSFNLKLAATGSKPITWGIVPDTEVQSADLLALGLKFDEKSGQIYGIPGIPTSTDGEYKTIEVKIYAENAAGSADTQTNPTTVKIGIKGRKPKLGAMSLVHQIENAANEPALSLRTDIAKTDIKSFVKWALNSNTAKAIKGGITVADSDDRNIGVVTVDDDSVVATKGATFKVSADNVGTTVLANVKITINDPKPVVTVDSDTVNITASKSGAKTGKAVFSIADKYKTGDTTIKWAITQKPTGKVTAAIKAASNGKSATITFTVPKGVNSGDVPLKNGALIDDDGLIHTKVIVTATNNMTKETGSEDVEVIVTPYDGARSVSALPAQKDALPEEKSDEAEETLTEETETEAEKTAEEEETAEGTVSYGKPRTAETLTAEESAALSEAGYIVAAILPEVTADADGQYDLEAVALAENVPAGEALVWFAFPRNAEKSDDDTIAEFYDEAGAEITAVPESRNVIASPWLRKDVTYAPVIAVKAPVTSETKDSLDEATEGDTVTEQAIEEAAETSADETPAEE